MAIPKPENLSDRIDALVKDFPNHEYGRTLKAELVRLGHGEATIRCKVGGHLTITHAIVPRGEDVPKRLAQGGVEFSLANYAAVFAAMTLFPSGHTALRKCLNGEWPRPVFEGDVLQAIATVDVFDGEHIAVSIVVFANDQNKSVGNFVLSYHKPHGL